MAKTNMNIDDIENQINTAKDRLIGKTEIRELDIDLDIEHNKKFYELGIQIQYQVNEDNEKTLQDIMMNNGTCPIVSFEEELAEVELKNLIKDATKEELNELADTIFSAIEKLLEDNYIYE